MNLSATLTRILLHGAVLTAGCLAGGPRAEAAEVRDAPSAPQAHPQAVRKCPSRSELDAALANASSLMEQSRFEDAAAALQPISGANCDARVSLLLAATYDGRGDASKAIAVLKRAHAAWPSNNSIAASLAREDLNNKDTDGALAALSHFHVTPQTPAQEMELAAVVYLAAHRLASAQQVAEEAYKSYPSIHTLLLLANSLQLQGRYPEVNKLLASKRAEFASSPEFFVTLAESEFDASIFDDARDDLQRAIALDPDLYQAHYLLGNVLSRMNDADAAVAEYRTAIKLAPDQPRTYFQLALLLQSRQDEAGEQKLLEQALAADDHYAPAHSEMGRILLEDHKPADAVSHLLSAIRDNPRSEKSYYLLARASAQLGEREKSNQVVKQLRAVREQNHPNADNNTGGQAAAGRSPGP
jgi:tetratricopeptide (TPR) repeat protein